MLPKNLESKSMTRFFLPLQMMCVASLVVFAMPSLAHHGAGAHFDLDIEIQIEGVLTDFQLVNPHGFVYFDGLNEAGELEPWRCEMGTNLRRQASEETLLPGGLVLVTGNPARREDNLCKIELIEHQDGRTIAFNGRPTEGATDYQPSAQLATAASSSQGISAAATDVIAVSSSVASQRKIVDVPSEGFFGYWNASGDGFVGVAGIGRNSDPSSIQSDLAIPTAFAQPNYKPAGMELMEAFDERFDFPALRCESSVFDGIFHHGNNNEFVQESENIIRWTYGYMDLLRYIHLDQEQHPANLEPSLMGHSIGRWEGDTLVVKTKGFTKQWLHQVGGGPGVQRLLDGHVIASEQLSLVERFTHDEANDHLVVEYWMEDTEFWEAPLSGVYRLSRSDVPYQEYGCVELGGENNSRDDGTTIFD